MRFVRVVVLLPEPLLEAIDRYCEEQGYKRSELIRLALREFLERRGRVR